MASGRAPSGGASPGRAPSGGGSFLEVVLDVPSLRKVLHYSYEGSPVPIGTEVRATLRSKSLRGWVVGVDDEPPEGVAVKEVRAIRSVGPPEPVVELARWAAWRWAGTWAGFLRSASSPVIVREIPAAGAHGPGSATARLDGEDLVSGQVREVGWGQGGDLVAEALGGGVSVVSLPPGESPYPVVEAAASMIFAQAGALRPGTGQEAGEGRPGALVLVPTHRMAAGLVRRARHDGIPCALLPDEWARARAGWCVAVGTRSAAFAPVENLVAAVVLDAHEETYYEERSPTWCAWQVVAERARREGAPCALLTACPTLDLLEAGRLVRPPRELERRGWPQVSVIDRRAEDPRTGLFSRPVVDVLRAAGHDEHGSGENLDVHGAGPGRGEAVTTSRVLCVLNRTGRARLLSCAVCGELIRCELCGGPMNMPGAPLADELAELSCGRCQATRPALCGACGSVHLKVVRAGVSRVREEIEALTGSAVAEVWGPAARSRRLSAGGQDSRAEVARGADAGVGNASAPGPPAELMAPIVIGTEAVLYRISAAWAVVFLDFDSELLAPWYRASEEALALLARAARIVSRAGEGGRLLVQTRQPDHEVLQAARTADPLRSADAERPLRSALGLPPFSALARISGQAAGAYAARIAAGIEGSEHPGSGGLELRQPGEGTWELVAADHGPMLDLLAALERPAGRLRVEVDPVRL